LGAPHGKILTTQEQWMKLEKAGIPGTIESDPTLMTMAPNGFPSRQL